MVNAMSSLRCYAKVPGIPESVPMKVEENGWPTQPPGRSYEKQAEALRLMVRAVHDFRGTYNVVDYRWFNLRDGDTASPLLFQHFGLLESDYDPKPAFDDYRRLVNELSVRDSAAGGGGSRWRWRSGPLAADAQRPPPLRGLARARDGDRSGPRPGAARRFPARPPAGGARPPPAAERASSTARATAAAATCTASGRACDCATAGSCVWASATAFARARR